MPVSPVPRPQREVTAVTTLDDRTVKVADLLDRPGASRPLDLALEAPEDLDLAALAMAEVDGPLRFTGVVESVVDGLLVRGTLSAPLRLQCARCLQPVQRTVQADVVELFTDPADAEDPDDVEAGYEIVEGTLNFETLLRDALAPAVPVQPLCRPDCAGLCPTCGVDRNVSDCDCTEDTTDARWAALEQLRLDDGPDDDGPAASADGHG